MLAGVQDQVGEYAGEVQGDVTRVLGQSLARAEGTDGTRPQTETKAQTCDRTQKGLSYNILHVPTPGVMFALSKPEMMIQDLLNLFYLTYYMYFFITTGYFKL